MLDKEEIKKLILELIRNNPGILFSEIVEALQLDPDIVAVCLDELEEEGKIESVDIVFIKYNKYN